MEPGTLTQLAEYRRRLGVNLPGGSSLTQTEELMDTAAVIAELESERNRIKQAIAALQGGQAAKGRRGRRRLSAAARKRISEGMKRRWAARKKAS
jgi:hypothetical protein